MVQIAGLWNMPNMSACANGESRMESTSRWMICSGNKQFWGRKQVAWNCRIRYGPEATAFPDNDMHSLSKCWKELELKWRSNRQRGSLSHLCSMNVGALHCNQHLFSPMQRRLHHEYRMQEARLEEVNLLHLEGLFRSLIRGWGREKTFHIL